MPPAIKAGFYGDLPLFEDFLVVKLTRQENFIARLSWDRSERRPARTAAGSKQPTG